MIDWLVGQFRLCEEHHTKLGGEWINEVGRPLQEEARMRELEELAKAREEAALLETPEAKLAEKIR